jgi:L-ascorbate metabolism protein UlaG (beta-lactamase superfamily)
MGIRPSSPVPSVKTDLRGLDPSKNLIVWFGHSSYLIQVDGKRILVDPVFFKASPVSFINRAFPGTKIYKPEDMPDIDYLVITHDHWDHLDYKTVKRLRHRVGTVICPLGVGSDLEYWGYPLGKIKEMDWYEDSSDSSFVFHCLPTRHFSGRGLTPNKTLWASYLLETPSMKIFIGGDGGYDGRYLRIGKKFPGIDLAILENGQYNQSWKYIHTMPEYLDREVHELGATSVMTVHHSKYALAMHPWDEPLKNELKLAQDTTIHVLIPTIGKPMKIGK